MAVLDIDFGVEQKTQTSLVMDDSKEVKTSNTENHMTAIAERDYTGKDVIIANTELIDNIDQRTTETVVLSSATGGEDDVCNIIAIEKHSIELSDFSAITYNDKLESDTDTVTEAETLCGDPFAVTHESYGIAASSTTTVYSDNKSDNLSEDCHMNQSLSIINDANSELLENVGISQADINSNTGSNNVQNSQDITRFVTESYSEESVIEGVFSKKKDESSPNTNMEQSEVYYDARSTLDEESNDNRSNDRSPILSSTLKSDTIENSSIQATKVTVEAILEDKAVSHEVNQNVVPQKFNSATSTTSTLTAKLKYPTFDRLCNRKRHLSDSSIETLAISLSEVFSTNSTGGNSCVPHSHRLPITTTVARSYSNNEINRLSEIHSAFNKSPDVLSFSKLNNSLNSPKNSTIDFTTSELALSTSGSAINNYNTSITTASSEQEAFVSIGCSEASTSPETSYIITCSSPAITGKSCSASSVLLTSERKMNVPIAVSTSTEAEHRSQCEDCPRDSGIECPMLLCDASATCVDTVIVSKEESNEKSNSEDVLLQRTAASKFFTKDCGEAKVNLGNKADHTNKEHFNNIATISNTGTTTSSSIDMQSRLDSIDMLQSHLASRSQESAYSIICSKQNSSAVIRSPSPLFEKFNIKNVHLKDPSVCRKHLAERSYTRTDSFLPVESTKCNLDSDNSYSEPKVSSLSENSMRYKFLFDTFNEQNSQPQKSKTLTTIISSVEHAQSCVPARSREDSTNEVNSSGRLITEDTSVIAFIDDETTQMQIDEEKESENKIVKADTVSTIEALEYEKMDDAATSSKIIPTANIVNTEFEEDKIKEDEKTADNVQTFCLEPKEIVKDFPMFTLISPCEVTCDTITEEENEDDASQESDNTQINKTGESSSSSHRTSREIYYSNVQHWEKYMEAAATGKLSTDARTPKKNRGVAVLPHPSSSFLNTGLIETVKLRATGINLIEDEKSDKQQLVTENKNESTEVTSCFSEPGIKKNFNLTENRKVSVSPVSSITSEESKAIFSSEKTMFETNIWEGRKTPQNEICSTNLPWQGRIGEWAGLKNQGLGLTTQRQEGRDSQDKIVNDKTFHEGNIHAQAAAEKEITSTETTSDNLNLDNLDTKLTENTSGALDVLTADTTEFGNRNDWVGRCEAPVEKLAPAFWAGRREYIEEYSKCDAWVGRRDEGEEQPKCETWLGRRGEWEGRTEQRLLRHKRDRTRSSTPPQILLEYLHQLLSKHSAKVAAGNIIFLNITFVLTILRFYKFN